MKTRYQRISDSGKLNQVMFFVSELCRLDEEYFDKLLEMNKSTLLDRSSKGLTNPKMISLDVMTEYEIADILNPIETPVSDLDLTAETPIEKLEELVIRFKRERLMEVEEFIHWFRRVYELEIHPMDRILEITGYSSEDKYQIDLAILMNKNHFHK